MYLGYCFVTKHGVLVHEISFALLGQSKILVLSFDAAKNLVAL
jgi:hypothetical protein